MKNIKAVFKREFKAYFDSPVAYVFLTAFLVLAGFLTFGVAMFFERRQADLTPFFFWHPWVYLLLVPAATMGVWADERRNGTAELLLTLPVTITEVLVGKFLAAWSFVGIGLALTFPVALTAGYLGSPDWGAVFCGYLGSLLLSGAAVAIGVFASTLSRSSVVGFVVSLALVFLLLIIGFDPVIGAVAAWGVPTAITDSVASCSLLSHFESMRRGVVDFADIGYYFAMMVFMLAAAKTVTDGRRGASKGVVGLVLVGAIAASSVVILANLPLRCDMTAENLYTLSKGSKAILGQLTEDVTLKYYVSSSSAEMPMALKTYAQQVGNLLKEYERAGGGRLVVEEYDPKPDSDAEEWAQRYGVEPQTGGNPFGQGIYFGVVAVCGDREETLGVLSPRTESTLEYDLTRLVTRVAWPERPVVGVMTSLPDVLGGQMNPMMMQMGQRPPQGWAAFSELAKDYDGRREDRRRHQDARRGASEEPLRQGALRNRPVRPPRRKARRVRRPVLDQGHAELALAAESDDGADGRRRTLHARQALRRVGRQVRGGEDSTTDRAASSPTPRSSRSASPTWTRAISSSPTSRT